MLYTFSNLSNAFNIKIKDIFLKRGVRKIVQLMSYSFFIVLLTVHHVNVTSFAFSLLHVATHFQYFAIGIKRFLLIRLTSYIYIGSTIYEFLRFCYHYYEKMYHICTCIIWLGLSKSKVKKMTEHQTCLYFGVFLGHVSLPTAHVIYHQCVKLNRYPPQRPPESFTQALFRHSYLPVNQLLAPLLPSGIAMKDTRSRR